MNYEPWIWTELLAFDNTLEDQGVCQYIQKTGFIPKAICLLVSSPDFVLLHKGMENEFFLPPDVCSRDAQAGNEERKRQDWTNFQVKSLVENLHEFGVEVYISMFTVYHENKFHKEWVSEHEEVLQVWDFQGAGLNINCLARLKDGSYFEDLFIPKVVQTALDYGFDGWHGPDGYGPLTAGTLAYTDCSDDMMRQFSEFIEQCLPKVATCNSNNKPTVLQPRMEWIWKNLQFEWIEFNITRVETFWKKMVKALHDKGKKAFINSAWTKAGFEAMYRYGIDYKRIAATGVDGMIVETVAGNLSLFDDSRDRHYDFIAMLLEIKAITPDLKLIFLHGIKDVNEKYDLLRHKPLCLEKELYSLANLFYRKDGELKRVAEGFLACLGDGLTNYEWGWLKQRWDISFAEMPVSSGDITLLWSENVFDGQMKDYIKNRYWSSHRQLYYLLERGVRIQTAARFEELSILQGAILIPSFHLLSKKELKQVSNYKGGLVILLGDINRSHFFDGTLPNIQCESIACFILNNFFTGNKDHLQLSKKVPEPVEERVPLSFKDELPWNSVPEIFWSQTAKAINNAISNNMMEGKDICYPHIENSDLTTLMSLKLSENEVQIALKNKTSIYIDQKVEMSSNIEGIKIIGDYPLEPSSLKGESFTVRIPCGGITILNLNLLA